MYTFEQLKEDVRKEAQALRVHATKEERGMLDIDMLGALTIRGCYYGQMTGNCYSKRAAELIQKCCCRYFQRDVLPNAEEEYNDIEMIQSNMVGSEVFEFVKSRVEPVRTTYYSAIEAYILLPEANNANLIAYLRGETETLEL